MRCRAVSTRTGKRCSRNARASASPEFCAQHAKRKVKHPMVPRWAA